MQQVKHHLLGSSAKHVMSFKQCHSSYARVVHYTIFLKRPEEDGSQLSFLHSPICLLVQSYQEKAAAPRLQDPQLQDYGLCPWINSLPSLVPLPFLEYSETELEACQDQDAVQEANSIRSVLRACFVVRHSFAWKFCLEADIL